MLVPLVVAYLHFLMAASFPRFVYRNASCLACFHLPLLINVAAAAAVDNDNFVRPFGLIASGAARLRVTSPGSSIAATIHRDLFDVAVVLFDLYCSYDAVIWDAVVPERNPDSYGGLDMSLQTIDEYHRDVDCHQQQHMAN